MSKTDDGGPAFPIPNSDLAGSYEAAPGMSLRDWFAGQAMAAICGDTEQLKNLAMDRSDELGEDKDANLRLLQQSVARVAFSMADAMLEASKEAK